MNERAEPFVLPLAGSRLWSQTVSIPASPAQVFDVIADQETLPLSAAAGVTGQGGS